MFQSINAECLIPVINDHSDDIPTKVYHKLIVDIAALINDKKDSVRFALRCGIVIEENN